MDNINSFKERQREEAILRLEELTKVFSLDSDILESLKKGEILCSYQTGKDDFELFEENGWVPKSFIQKFEKSQNAYVYHIISCDDGIFDTIPTALLFVSNDEKDWAKERLCKDNPKTIKCFFFDCMNKEEIDFDDLDYEFLYLGSKEGILTMGDENTPKIC